MKTESARTEGPLLRHARRRADPGFTLIEITVVILIIGIVAAIVIPRTTAMGRAALKSSARNLAGTINLVYSTAILDKKTCRIVFNFEQQAYWAEKKQGKEWVAADSELLAPRALPDNVFIRDLEAGGRSCEEGSCAEEYLYFTPGGYVEQAAIHLGIVDDDPVISVFTRPLTGKAVIVIGDMTRAEWEDEEEETR